MQQIEKQNKSDKYVCSKTDHVINYLRFTAKYVGEYGVGKDIVHILMLPYETVQEVFEEYQAHYKRSVQMVCFIIIFI